MFNVEWNCSWQVGAAEITEDLLSASPRLRVNNSRRPHHALAVDRPLKMNASRGSGVEVHDRCCALVVNGDRPAAALLLRLHLVLGHACGNSPERNIEEEVVRP